MTPTPLRGSLIDVVVPVHDEQATLAANIAVLTGYLGRELPFRWRVTIADNASSDDTPQIAAELAARRADVHHLRLEQKGRGLALRTARLASEADIVSYMDVDLSTNLESFLPLVAPIVSGHSELAIGSRLARQARVRRQIKREVLSRGYNALVHAAFRSGFSDAQCGFKAVRADVARLLVPHIEDDGWQTGGTSTGRGAGVLFSGTPGPLRLINDAMGDQGGWLLPFAIIGGVVALALALRARDRMRLAALVVVGGWFLAGAVVFSYAGGSCTPTTSRRSRHRSPGSSASARSS